jgi:hypothetical protein
LKRFLAHLARFGALPVAVLLAGEFVLIGSGEAWPVERVLAFQRAHAPSLFLRALDQAFYAFKYQGIVDRQPAVLVLGSSRTMKFRAGMFGNSGPRFFNAGGMVNSLSDLRAFCFARPPSPVPATLILGIDLWWLNAQVQPVYQFEREIERDRTWTFDQHIVGLRWLIVRPSVLARELGSLATRRQPDAIGLGAREGRGGFRPDGSFATAVPVPQPGDPFVDREDPPIIERVRTATANFVPTDHLSPERLAMLASVLDEYQRQHRLVIGYLPPFSTAVAQQLASDPRQAVFYGEFRQVVPALFAAHAFPVVDASDTRALGMDDRGMSDGFHGEETLHARVVRLMLRDPRVWQAFPDADAVIARALESPRTNAWQVDLPD